MYIIGNFLGGCKVETSLMRQDSSNGSTTDLIGVGYNLGGIMIETAYASIEEKDNGVLIQKLI